MRVERQIELLREVQRYVRVLAQAATLDKNHPVKWALTDALEPLARAEICLEDRMKRERRPARE